MPRVMPQQRRTCRRLKSRSPQPRRAKRGQRISDLRPRGESLGGRRLKAYAEEGSDFLSNDTFTAMLTNLLTERIDNAEIELKIKPAPKWIPKRLWLKLASLFVKLNHK